MIHWYQDRNEDTWVNEGLSELATFLNGLGPSDFMMTFLALPDTQLTSWATSTSNSTANYGASFLFMAYFLEHYGEEPLKEIVANPSNGIIGFNEILTKHKADKNFDDIFADFVVANYLQDPTINEGVWGYTSLSPTNVGVVEKYQHYPVEQTDTVHQYGTDYIELYSQTPLTIEFTGSTELSVINNQPHSGDYQWYGHRGDDSDTRLTRPFDLSNVDEATLEFWSWYDIEPDWDYAYVEISTDEGQNWVVLKTEYSSTDNPSGNAYGPGYTGTSGDWLKNQIDISDYTGQEVLVRFEYVTDDAVNHPGFVIDDIAIPEIEFFDDVETGPNDWQAEGFVRIDNRLSQKFMVQVIEMGDHVTVHRLLLDENNTGKLTLDGLGNSPDSTEAVLIVSGLAPVTTELAEYSYRIDKKR
jgi:hypothetical protein